ncbi:hypothetical protein A0H81_13414 [Grifola frondosa]|uniref:Uncharacterized protein n=1 Tax=Grifola frondosa TaxID=5627 RepID=A0A1C7LP52_GRIFR|nr:hypothetical protein A0H81_13414 [Grifola frondosa]
MDTVNSQDPAAVRSRIARLDPLALNELNAIDKLIADAASKPKGSKDASDKKGNKDIAGKILKGISHVLEVAESVAEIQPIAARRQDFSKMLSLELQRRENNEQIAVVYHSMTHLVYTLRHLEPILDIEDDIDFSEILTNIETTMKEFGRFVNLYYKCRQKIFHVLFSQNYKDEMGGYLGQFDQHKQDLESLINTRFMITTHTRLDGLFRYSETIINKLNEGDAKMQAATAFIEAHGGPDAVKMDDVLLTELAKTLNEKLTTSIKSTLHEDFSVLLEESAKQYTLKLNNVQVTITASVSSAQEAILRRLNEGPYEMIVDEDIKAVWKQNSWKTSVKCRVFVDALHEYYQRKFDEYMTTENARHNDYWTLQFLSKVMSGRVAGITITYRERFLCMFEIDLMILTIQESPSPADVKDELRKLLDYIKPLVLSADVEEDGWDGCDELVQLQDQYMETEEGSIKQQLEEFGFDLEDESALSSVTNDSRIELHIMCLLYVLMERLQTTISQLLDGIDNDEALVLQKTFEGLSSSFLATFYTFDDRMDDLVRCWRQQGKNIDLQIDRYADGLFVNWYKEADEENNALDRLQSFLEDGDEDESSDGQVADKLNSQQAKIDELVLKVSSFEDRLASIESLLRKLVANNESATTAIASQDENRTEPSGPDGQGEDPTNSTGGSEDGTPISPSGPDDQGEDPRNGTSGLEDTNGDEDSDDQGW